MAFSNHPTDQDPLLPPSPSRASPERDDQDEEPDISMSRGACIVASVGLLIFLQGMPGCFSSYVPSEPSWPQVPSCNGSDIHGRYLSMAMRQIPVT